MPDNKSIPIIDIINNPYTQKLCILIDGRHISEFSSLRKFIDEPFNYWCDKIINEIYEECNRKNFIINFFSRKEELKIFNKIAKVNSCCVSINCYLNEISLPLQDRLCKLNSIVKNYSLKNTCIYNKKCCFIFEKNFEYLESLLRDIDVKNSFCCINPIFEKNYEYIINEKKVDIIFFIGKDLKINHKINSIYTYAINIDNKTDSIKFINKINNTYQYKCNENNLIGAIFECLLLNPLLDIFRSCIFNDYYSYIDRNIIEELTSIHNKIHTKVETTIIEAGRSVRISFSSNASIDTKSFIYKYSDQDIIFCNGLVVEGLKEGNSNLYIYRPGELDPISVINFKVIKSNKINSIYFKDDYIIVGKGSKYNIDIGYNPNNADNADKIRFKSDNQLVAHVNNNGILVANSVGKCTIICSAEQVSTRCICEVKPYLQKIIPEYEEIDITTTIDHYILKVNTQPENCIDSYLVYSSMDNRVVNALSNKLIPHGTGKTKIIIQNKEETVRAEVIVNVMTEKEYKKKMQQIEKEAKKAHKKKSALATIFDKFMWR